MQDKVPELLVLSGLLSYTNNLHRLEYVLQLFVRRVLTKETYPYNPTRRTCMCRIFPFFLCLLFALNVSAQDTTALNKILNSLEPELVQPGTVSTPGFEFGTSISPDGKEMFFIKGIAGFRRTVLVYSKWTDGYWTSPQIAPFSGKFRDMNPYHSKDGKRLYFTSDRPTTNEALQASNFWYVDVLKDGWSEPKLVPGVINDQYEIVYPTVHKDGTVHFVAWSRPDSKNGDIYISKLKNGKYTAPALVEELNTEQSDADPEMTLDGKFMFITSQREGGLGHYDLYVFKKEKNGKWGDGINLGPKVNSHNMDSDPILSPNGKTLYYSSDKLDTVSPDRKPYTDYQDLIQSYNQIHNGLMNIYKVDISELLDFLS